MPATFAAISRAASAAFIQTVVVVDDEASLAEVQVPRKLRPPAEVARSEASGQTRRTTKGGRPSHPLNAKVLADGFAALGIVATVLRPNDDQEVEAFDTAVVKTSARVDVLVLDWHIAGDEGERATSMIRRVLRSDSQSERVRLVVIYTGDNDVSEVAAKLGAALGSGFSIDQDKCVLTSDRVRFVVLTKAGTRVAPGLESLVVSEQELPKRIIGEFANHTAGLLSNLALAYLASVRSNTHRLLSKFPAKLDAAYVGDRIAQELPDDAVELALSLVAQSIAGSVEVAKLGEFIDVSAIEAWLNQRKSSGVIFQVPAKQAAPAMAVSDAVLSDLIRRGRNQVTPPVGVARTRWDQAPSLTGVLCGSDDPNLIDHEFAQLTCLARTHMHVRAHDPAPRLQLGSVVVRRISRGHAVTENYYVCVQPICDSIRLNRARAFPLLPLAVIEKDQFKDFDLAIPGFNGTLITGQIDVRPFDVVVPVFAPDLQAKAVVAHRRPVKGRRKWAFREHSGALYYWIADLRDEQAQRVVHNYAGRASRVGVAESEWARTAGNKRLS